MVRKQPKSSTRKANSLWLAGSFGGRGATRATLLWFWSYRHRLDHGH